jgi:hypothetical protein
MHGGEQKCIRGFGWETWRKETARLRSKWMDNIKIHLKEMGCEIVEWINLVLSTEGPLVCCCELRTELLHSIKCGEIVGYLRKY